MAKFLICLRTKSKNAGSLEILEIKIMSMSMIELNDALLLSVSHFLHTGLILS